MTEATNEQLLKACQEADVDAVESLLREGANAAYEQKKDGTWGAHDTVSPIHYALRCKDPEKRLQLVSTLLEHNAKVDCSEEHYDWRGCGHSTSAFELALSCANDSNDPEILRVFLENKADPNQVSVQDIHSMRTDGRITNTLLTDAVSSMSVPIIKCLLEGGADPNLERKNRTNNEYGYCSNTQEAAIHLCAASKDENALVVLDLLIKHKADVNQVRSYLHQEKCEKPDYAKLVDDPRDSNYHSGLKTTKVKETAIHTAIKSGNSLIVKALIDHNINTTIPYTFGDTEQSMQELITTSCKDEQILHELNFAIGGVSLAKSARK